MNAAPAGKIAIAVILSLASLSQVFAATINVDSDCTVVDAINEANNSLADTDCEDGDDYDANAGEDGHDTIVIPAGSATWVVDDYAKRIPRITTRITINGNGNTIDGNDGNMRGFRPTRRGARHFLEVRDGADLTINRLTITQGGCEGENSKNTCRGGAIRIYGGGKLTLNNSVVSNSDNTATRNGGAIIASGTLTRASLTIVGSSIFGNTSAYGGGAISLASGVNFVMRGSSVYNNNAGSYGGGIAYFNPNTTNPGKITISDSSIFGNTAQGDRGGGICYRKQNH